MNAAKHLFIIASLASITLGQGLPGWQIITDSPTPLASGVEIGGLHDDYLMVISRGDTLKVAVSKIARIRYNYHEGTNWRTVARICGLMGFAAAFIGSYADLGYVGFSIYAGAIVAIPSWAVGALLGSLSKKIETISLDLMQMTDEEKKDAILKMYVLWKAGTLKKGSI